MISEIIFRFCLLRFIRLLFEMVCGGMLRWRVVLGGGCNGCSGVLMGNRYGLGVGERCRRYGIRWGGMS